MEINLEACLEGKNTLNELSVSDIAKIANSYPYCSAAHMILAKKLYVNKSTNCIEAIKKAAIYVADIELLEKYIKSEASLTNKTYDRLTTDTTLQPKKNDHAKNLDINRHSPHEPPIGISKPKITPPTYSERISDNNSKPLSTITNDKKDIKIIGQQYSSSDKEPVADNNLVCNLQSKEAKATFSNDKLVDRLDVKPEQYALNKENVLKDTQKSFEEWLELQDYKTYENIDIELPKVVKHRVKVSEIEGIKLINDTNEEEIEVELDATNPQDKIIGGFIATNPKISIYNREDAPLDEDNTPYIDYSDQLMVVSEYLLDIYLAQGLYKEAMNMCQKLIAKEPEKNIYYNKKLEDIKNLMVKIR